MGLLIDSTVLVQAERAGETVADLIRSLLERFGDRELSLSVMSAAELIHGCWRADTTARRALREDYVETLLAAIPVVPVTLPVARIFGQHDAQLRAAGHTVPTSDLLIAATALARGDEVLTGNRRHFDWIPGLTVHDHPPGTCASDRR